MKSKKQKTEKKSWRVNSRKSAQKRVARDSRVRRPNALLYCVAYVIAYPLLKLLFRLDDGRRDFAPPKGPFIVVSNHSTMLDFLFAMLPFYPRRINAVATNRYFFKRPLDKILPIMGCIPKSQFDPDIMSIKRVKTVLKRGGCILLFPEGRCSTDGSFAGIHKATGKLVKNLGVPVISCYIDGAYTCLPHWRKGIRLGRVRVTMAELFSAEDTNALTVEELNDAICARLSGEDNPRSGKPTQTFGSRRLAEGLEKILNWCPKCGLQLTMASKGNEFRCTACGNSAMLDKAGKLTPSQGSIVPNSIQDWYSEQTRYITESLGEDMEPIRINVSIHVTPAKVSDGVVQEGNGTLSVEPKGFTFEGELGGEVVDVFFPVETVPAVPFEYDGNFLIYAFGNIYRFMPEDARLSVLYSLLAEAAHRRFSSRAVLTPGQNKGFHEHEGGG
ncbi:MAG: 1-acyl-sn-glycerol-3-phosphate acyltransferase [Oscillospiraceae bacterium]|nr:1-acyl-sn-glycerol-3-phosphate acyltransferase [Oscillospiraceae bacterium]